MNINHFRATKENPFHISIGGLVYNEAGKILVHHFKNKKMGLSTFENLYLLLRETMEPNESIEQTLHRGLLEEFGATGETVRFLGSLQSRYPLDGTWVEKTTLYFLVKYTGHDELKRQEGSSESESALEWIAPKELLVLLKKQATINVSLDESVIVKRFLEL